MRHQPEPRFSECRECKFFKPFVNTRRCKQCGAGEFFEEKINENFPNADDLMDIFKDMSEEDYD
jgi:hypothetical protein